MKKIFALVAAGLTLVAATSCDREDNAASTDSVLKSITLTISGANLTKASALGSGDEVWATTAPDMTSYDVYFTNGSEILYSWRLADGGDYSDAYTALANNNAVRFVGLTGVSAVYVVCNYDGDLLEEGDDPADLKVDLLDQSGLVANTAIVYVGGDTQITPINDEHAEKVDATIWDENSKLQDPYYYSQYYKAEVYIRPVISRLEIASIGVQTTGTYTPDKAYTYNGTPIYYQVEWEGFAPELKGIYMSNFYGTLCPVTPTAADEFETPTGDRITNTDYLWDEKSDGIYGTDYNADGVTLYSDSGTNLFDAGDADTDGVAWYFDGSDDDLCVPFNFLVPFDVTRDSTDGLEWYSSVTELYPAWHFCFTFDASATTDYKYTLYVSEDRSAYTEYAESDYADDEILYNKLTANFDFTTFLINDSRNYYANITEMLTTNGGDVDIESNTIYKMAKVIINPYNFSTSTKTEDAYNIVVYVTTVDYATVDVTPSFDAN